MTRRMIKVMSAFAALSIAAASVTATANIASAAAPSAQVAQVAEDQGVLIVSVQKDGPAAKAGLRRGDIVLKVNETEVNDSQALRDALGKLKAGDEVKLQVARGDSELTLTATLGDADGRAILGVTPFGNAPSVQAAPAPAPAPSQGGQDEKGEQGEAEEGQSEGSQRAPQLDRQQAEELRKRLEEQMQSLAQTRIVEVTENSPAAKAGLKKGDVILSVNDTKLDAQNSLADVVGRLKPGDEVTLTIKRDNKEQELKVTLSENPDKKGVAFLGIRYAPTFGMMQLPEGFPNNLPFPVPGRRGQGGDEGNTPFEIPGNMAAVTIGNVVQDSPAAKAGLKQGDVITAANDKEIKEPTDLVNLVQSSKPGDKVTLTVTREGQAEPVEITVTLGENPDKKGTAYMGVSLGQFIRFERNTDGQGNSEGFEIVPGFRLPFDFGNMPFEIPQQREELNREA